MASYKVYTLILFLSYPSFHFPGLLELPPTPVPHASASSQSTQDSSKLRARLPQFFFFHPILVNSLVNYCCFIHRE